MFFRKRYFKSSRSLNKIYLFNVFFNFNDFCYEFMGYFGFFKIFLENFFVINKSNIISFFKFKNKNLKNFGYVYPVLFNVIKGLIFEYEKKIVIHGLGYKALVRSKYVLFYLSHTHPIVYKIPSDIKIILNLNEITIRCIDKCRVGQITLFLKSLVKPNIYKGKGILYFNEKIKLKIIKKK